MQCFLHDNLVDHLAVLPLACLLLALVPAGHYIVYEQCVLLASAYLESGLDLIGEAERSRVHHLQVKVRHVRYHPWHPRVPCVFSL